jgi:deoxyadenosine/deoxycytidine kinase
MDFEEEVSQPKLIFALEGPIGVGKSSVLRELQDTHNCRIYPEPVEKWEPALTKFYMERTAQSAIKLQELIGDTLEIRHGEIRTNDDGEQPIVMERSLYSGLRVFTHINSKIYPSSGWDKVYQNYCEAFKLLEGNGICRIGLQHDSFYELCRRTGQRGVNMPEAFATTRYLKEVYDQCTSFQDDCHFVVNVTNKTPKEIGDEVIVIINNELK